MWHPHNRAYEKYYLNETLIDWCDIPESGAEYTQRYTNCYEIRQYKQQARYRDKSNQPRLNIKIDIYADDNERIMRKNKYIASRSPKQNGNWVDMGIFQIGRVLNIESWKLAKHTGEKSPYHEAYRQEWQVICNTRLQDFAIHDSKYHTENGHA